MCAVVGIYGNDNAARLASASLICYATSWT